MRHALDIRSCAELLTLVPVEQVFIQMTFTTVAKNLPACAMPVRTRAMEDALHMIVIQALEPYQGALRLGESASLAVLSAEDQQDHFLHLEEEQAVSPRACTRKRTEWALGRTASGRALRELGEVSSPVLRGDHGEPVWPEGITGSITHCWPWTAALLIKAGKRFAIGIDLENLKHAALIDISSVICNATELDWARGSDFQRRLAMIFSAKEAAYKGLHPLCRRYIDFKEVELAWLPQSQSFRVAFVGGPEAEFAALGECRVLSRLINGLVFSCFVHDTEEPARLAT